MKINIRIENCETIAAFYAHLSEIQRQIKRQTRKRKLDPIQDAFKRSDSDDFADANCYGEHYVKITTEHV